MGEVIFHDFADLEACERDLELYEAEELARTSPDLVLAAPALRDFLTIVRNDVLQRYGEIYPPVEALLEWLESRDPTPPAA
jgi:hypothetical protein